MATMTTVKRTLRNILDQAQDVTIGYLDGTLNLSEAQDQLDALYDQAHGTSTTNRDKSWQRGMNHQVAIAMGLISDSRSSLAHVDDKA